MPDRIIAIEAAFALFGVQTFFIFRSNRRTSAVRVR